MGYRNSKLQLLEYPQGGSADILNAEGLSVIGVPRGSEPNLHGINSISINLENRWSAVSDPG